MSNFGSSLFKSNTNDSESLLKQQIQQSEIEKSKQTILPTELFKTPSAVKSSVFKNAKQSENKIKNGGQDEDADMDDLESGDGTG